MGFDLAYYQRFYFNRRTAVTSRSEMRARARLISGCVDYIGLPVAKILDAGCGVGLLRTPLLRGLKRASYTGLEFSDYLCQRYGWRQGSIETYRTRERFDLVICYDVLQYLSSAQARRAIANLARLCRGALYFGAMQCEQAAGAVNLVLRGYARAPSGPHADLTEALFSDASAVLLPAGLTDA